MKIKYFLYFFHKYVIIKSSLKGRKKMSNRKNYDGMRYPSVDALLDKIDSKYKLAYAAAKRAKIIEEEDYTSYEDGMCVKPVGQALEEILVGKTKMTFK